MVTIGASSDKSAGKDRRPQAAPAMTPASRETAAYLADMCVELALLARKADLALLAHLLAMAQAEALNAADGDSRELAPNRRAT